MFEAPAILIPGRQDHVVGFQDQVGLSAHYLQPAMAVLDRDRRNAHCDQQEITTALLKEWLVRMESRSKNGSSSLPVRRAMQVIARLP